MRTENRVLLLVSHGSREGSANLEFKRLARKYQARHPRWKVSHAFLELARPSIPEALESLVHTTRSADILVLPYFLFAARHVKKDIPAIIKIFRKKYPRVKVRMAKPLGSDPKLLDVLDLRLNQIFQK